MKRKTGNRFLAILLSVVILISMTPCSIFAMESDIAPVSDVSAMSEVIDTAGFDEFFAELDEEVVEVSNDQAYPFTVVSDGDEGKVLQSAEAQKGQGYSEGAVTFTFLKAARLKFWYRTSTEERYDYLRIRVKADGEDGWKILNDGKKADFSGEKTDYTEYSIEANEGDAVELAYYKDSSGNAGNDCIWMKDFSLEMPVQIMLHANNGTDETAAQGVFQTMNLKANPFEYEGHRFKGWAASENGEVVYADGAEYTLTEGSPRKLYAVWAPVYTAAFTVTENADFALYSDADYTEEIKPVAGTREYILENGTYYWKSSLFGYEDRCGEVTINGNDENFDAQLTAKPTETVTVIFADTEDKAVKPSEIENLKLTVETGKQVIDAETAEDENTLTYRLPVGYAYTYTFKSKAYAKVTDTIDLTEQTESGARPLKIQLTEKTAWGGSDDIVEPNQDANDVYEISSGGELAWLAQQVNNGAGAKYKAVLTKNIDLGGEQWTPIGYYQTWSDQNPFQGEFDGQGHSITGLQITANTSGDYGLFGYVDGGTVRNVTVDGSINVTAGGTSNGTAGIVGNFNGTSGEISGCVNKVTVHGNQNVGGIAGYVNGGYNSDVAKAKCISGCANLTEILAAGNNAGGVVGYIDGPVTLADSYNRGDISTGGWRAGGIAGYLNSSYANINNSYTTGAAAGSDASPIGKKSSGIVQNLYYLKNTGNDVNGTARNEEEMKSAEFVSLLGAAFIKDMDEPVNDGYPILAWQDPTPKYETVLTMPVDAEVVVKDGSGDVMTASRVAENEYGKNTYTYTLKEGTYTYEISAFGKETVNGTFEVKPEGENQILVRLNDKAKYAVSFNIAPEEAEPVITLKFGDKEIAPTAEEPYTWNLPEGDYTYVVKAKGYGKVSDTLTVTDGAKTILVTLEPSTAWDGQEMDEPETNEEGVYQISSGTELAWFAALVNGELNSVSKNTKADGRLTEDIDLGEELWTPIGSSYSNAYEGCFDGNGYTVSGLNVQATSNYAGLFGYVEGTSASHAKIQHVTVSGTVSSNRSGLGGIIGRGYYIDVMDCHNLCVVKADDGASISYVGGVAGYVEEGTVTDCSNNGSVIGTQAENIGGIVGYHEYSSLSGCYNAGTVSGKTKVGGVIGYASGYDTEISDIYNVGNVTGTSAAGGLIGQSYAAVENGYTTGAVIGGSAAFGATGSSYTFNSIYYLDTLPADAKGTACTAAQLQDLAATLNGDRTPAVWKTAHSVNDGYPIFSWQKEEEPAEPVELDTAENVRWDSFRENYVDPDSGEEGEVTIHRPIVKWDQVAHAQNYTVTLWKEGFVWSDLTDDEQKQFNSDTLTARQKLMMIDEKEIINALTEDEYSRYQSLRDAADEAKLYDGNSDEAETAVAEFLLSLVGDSSHNIRLGYYVPAVEKVTEAAGIEDSSYDFTPEMKNQPEGRYYVTVTPIAKEDSGYVSRKPEELDREKVANLNAENEDACYNHLLRPYNLRWDGAVAKWNCDSENADFCSVILYEVTGSKDAPTYVKCAYELLEPSETSWDFGRYFRTDKRYAFAVRAEAGENSIIAGYAMSPISEYSEEYAVGSPVIPGEDTDREDWIAISSAKEWIELANVEDVAVSETDNTSKQSAAWGKKYYLTADLDFSQLTAAEQTKTKSIGNVNNLFMGVMDGNGHKITGLTLSNRDSGLFSYIGASGLVYDLTIENANVLFSDNAAVLAHNNFGTIQNCTVEGCNITADTGAVLGGMVSRNYGVIRHSYVEGGSLTSNSLYATGHAGFVGANEEGGLIENCWTSMDVNTGSEYAGGFVGLGYGGTIRNCFALGDVTARSYSGGFVGSSVFNGNLYENCYAAGKVTVSSGIEGHGFISPRKPDSAFQPDISQEVKNCYYNSQSPEDVYAFAESLEDMRTSAFLQKLNGDGSIWVQDEAKNDGLPYLRSVKAPQPEETTDIQVEIALVTYDKEKYAFSQMGDTITVSMKSSGNVRLVDVMDEAQKQGKLTYSYETNSSYGRYIHTINGYAIEAPDGWMFTINDALSNVSASVAKVEDGDKILWFEGTTANLFKGPTWESLTSGETVEWIDIETEDQLKKLAQSSDPQELSGTYRLTRDLDLAGLTFGGIGSASVPFTGRFDGMGHTISNVIIQGSGNGTGFFNVIQNATIQNLHLVNVDVQGENQVGGLAGIARAQLNSEDMAKNQANLIGNCSVSGKVTAIGKNAGGVGGLVGENCKEYDKDTLFTISSAIDKCTAKVDVTGYFKAGGLVGNNGGVITESSATGSVTGIDSVYAGGFVGDNSGDIYDSHAEGSVKGASHTGGFVGFSDGVVKSCYSLGNVTGTDYTGSFAGAISNADYVIGAGKVTQNGTSTQGYNGGFAGQLGGKLSGVEQQITIKDAYGNCTAPDQNYAVIGNSNSFKSDSDKEKLTQMTLSTMSEVSAKLYEMFGINLPITELTEEAEKYQGTAIAADEAEESVISLLKQGQQPVESVSITYKVADAFAEYLDGGNQITLKKTNDTAATIYVPVEIVLSSDAGSYTKSVTVTLQVSPEKRSDLMDAIAASYKSTSDGWTVMDMAVYDTLEGKTAAIEEEALQNTLNLLITEAGSDKATASDRARLEIVLRAMGIDSTKLYEANSLEAIDNAKTLASMDLTAGGYYSAPWILLSELEGNVKLTDAQREALIGSLKDNMGDGLFGYTWDGTAYTDVDTAAAAVAALASYYDTNADAKEIIDQILAALTEAQDENGSFGSANSDAMVILGLLTMGQDPCAYQADSGASVVDGLLSYVNPETQRFTFGGSDNELATEQAFRALIALEKYDGENPYNIYDFGDAAVVPGHATGQGTIVVPPTPGEDQDDIAVKMSIQSNNGMWMTEKTVELKKGSTVYHAFVKALAGSGITQEGAEKGYVRSMTKDGVTLGEMTMGANSGWLYKVNGDLPTVSLTSYTLNDGDEILWYYTADYTQEPPIGGGGFLQPDPEDPGIEIEDPNTPLDPGPEAVTSMVSSMKLTARSARTSKKNVKVTVKADKATTEAIKELKKMGYTVKYRYYRSTKKSSGYKSMLTKKANTYTNTYGKKGKMYYYKAQIRVYDKDGKLVAKTALKQCKYANRIWKK